MKGIAVASPSLALIKYWGKVPGGTNIPATPSLAVTLSELETRTVVEFAENDDVRIGEKPQSDARFSLVFDEIRDLCKSERRYHAVSHNNFPTAAGLASSSSGLAALVAAACACEGVQASQRSMSRIARIGSGSASRSIYGGFTVFPRGAQWARQIADTDHWPELRIVIAKISDAAKPLGSRDAMEQTRQTSPYYEAWIDHSLTLMNEAEGALLSRDIEKLGDAMRASYMSMFSTMFSARPPIVYWLPGSLEVIHRAAALRARGIPVWETMDAGPQVKLLTTADHEAELRDALSDFSLMVSRPGEGVRTFQEHVA